MNNEQLGLRLGPRTATPEWYGDRLDLDATINALLSATTAGSTRSTETGRVAWSSSRARTC